MFRNSSVPGLLITAIAAIAMAAGVFVLLVTATTPWLGLHLTPRGEAVVLDRSYLDFPMGTVVEAIGLSGETPRPIVALDILAEPDSLPTYAAMQEFYDRQSQLAVLLTAPELEVHLRDASGTTALALVMPDNRPLWSMPGSFWVQVLTGVASLLISGWVWALRPGQLAPGLFALSGLGTLIVTLTSAYYAHRGLALSGDVFAALTAVNHLGIFLFAGSLCGLFLIYPRPLLRRRWLPVLPALLIPLLILDTLHVGIEAEHYYVIVVGVTVAILLLIVAQWWATRSHPDERAALGWLGLSVAIAIASFSFLALAPGLLGLDNPLSQHYGAGAIVLIYVGLALGLRRYRLFELGEWAYRILFYMVGAFALLCLDALLIAGLNLGFTSALAISMLVVALLYLPLRDWIWRRILARKGPEQHEVFAAAMDVAFAPSRGDSAERWRLLLKKLYDPLDMADHASAPLRPVIEDDGLAMTLPPVAGAPALRLRFPFAGRGLFQPAHLALAETLVSLTERAEESRQAYIRGVGEERRRMARDLHDDVGARLLTGLHAADERTRPLLQAALSDIRAIVSGLAGDEAQLDLVLAQIRHEAARRLEAAGIELYWPLTSGTSGATPVDYRVHKALTSAAREIVSNVIRHSGASRLAVEQHQVGGRLHLKFSDNGSGLPVEALAGETSGYGLRSLRQRIADLGGTLNFASEGGAVVTFDLPLHISETPPEPGVQTSIAALDLPS